MTFVQEFPEPADVLYRIKRRLSRHVSYLAACEINESFSEYVLYEPIPRILWALGIPSSARPVVQGCSNPQ
jgi:hypothetical protein